MDKTRRSPRNREYMPTSVIEGRPKLSKYNQPTAEDYSDEDPGDSTHRYTYNQQSDDSEYLNISYNSMSSSSTRTSDSNRELLNCSSPRSTTRRPSSRATGLASHKNHFIILLVATFIAYASYYAYEVFTTTTKIDCNFDDIRLKLPEQDEYFWKTFETGVEHVINNDPTAPTTYLLLYNDTFLAKDMLRKVVDRIKTCMHTDHDPIIIHSTDLETTAILKDHGNLITEYKDKLSRSQIMTIKDVNELPGQIAQAFHYFCDEYNPVVHRAVIIFTLNISKNKHQMPYIYGPSTAIHLSERILKDLWKESLHDDVLNPLIARMTENVLYLRPNK